MADDISLTIMCSVCGATLYIQGCDYTKYDGILRIEVDPCNSCLDAAKGEGYDEGREDGKEEARE